MIESEDRDSLFEKIAEECVIKLSYDLIELKQKSLKNNDSLTDQNHIQNNLSSFDGFNTRFRYIDSYMTLFYLYFDVNLYFLYVYSTLPTSSLRKLEDAAIALNALSNEVLDSNKDGIDRNIKNNRYISINSNMFYIVIDCINIYIVLKFL